ncbi:MAG: hypothetical protein IPL59_08280 [Candidatus Competibacteraceae bacterium]|nr:hypothetical protein [Candidatus Competibacteraceae bacterium]
MPDRHDEQQPQPADAPDTGERREFLRSLGKWSQAVIGGVLLGGALIESAQPMPGPLLAGYGGSAAVGGRGSWVNRYGGGVAAAVGSTEPVAVVAGSTAAGAAAGSTWRRWLGQSLRRRRR